MTDCQTYRCDRDAELHRIPTAGAVPSEKKLCRPCFNAWKSGAYTTGPGNYRVENLQVAHD